MRGSHKGSGFSGTATARRGAATHEGAEARSLRVADLMSTSLVAVGPELTLREVIELLAEKHLSGAPVVANGRVVGVISANDVLAFEASTPGVPTERPASLDVGESELPEQWGEGVGEEEGAEPAGAYFDELWPGTGPDVAERFQELSSPEWDVLGEHTVAEAMSPGVRAVRPGTTVAAAAAYMLKAGIHRALVLDGGKLVGIITPTDIMRAVAERRLR